MLNEIIENELNKFVNDPNRQDESDVIEANKVLSEICDIVRNNDKKLGIKLDDAINMDETAIGEQYFTQGFKTALKLINEIHGGAQNEM